MPFIELDAWVEDEEGGSDAAYDLFADEAPIDRIEVEEFIRKLRKYLTEDKWGLTNAVGKETLVIRIERC